MKKLLLGIVGLFVLCSQIQASDFNWGVKGEFAGFKKWRSSATMSNEDSIMLATGNVIIGYVHVSSRGINSQIQFEQRFSTMDFRINGSSWAYGWTGTTVPAPGYGYATNAIGSPYGDLIYVMQESTTGWAYRTSQVTGAGGVPAKLEILWDYVFPPALSGQ